jgi:site-specific DNA-methyltransferase (adenine-specific)
VIGVGNLEQPWGPQHEMITFGTYQPSKGDRAFGKGRLAARVRKGSVIRVERMNSMAINHPTEKPVLLLRQLIESSSIIGDLVLDPFMGVGSTLVAARIEERKAIGIEVEERYCEIAANRLRQGVLDFNSDNHQSQPHESGQASLLYDVPR